MTITTLVWLGFGLAFLLFLFTKPGQIVVGLVLLSVAFGLAIFFIATIGAALGAALSGGTKAILLLSVLGAMFGFLCFKAYGDIVRTVKDRRARAARLKVLEERGARLWDLEHTPRDGEILPPQRYLSP
jgi:hypothetical protein